MKVFKFGGASVTSVERIQNMASIVKAHQGTPLLIVISAMGKTTNALEKVAEAFFQERKEDALQLFEQVKQQHLTTAKYLLVKNAISGEAALKNFFTEVEWLLHDKLVREFDYYYDQIVCIGELLSTSIISSYLNEIGITNTWLDVRDIFRTDNNFREAVIDWNHSTKQVQLEVLPILNKGGMVITQGFIGATDENESTTLGREGSDYTAAVFANILDAESQTIWKDVEGVMNADPKEFPEAQFIGELNYAEVIEMAYYGAQVIHPKTIKPLQNKGIPLLVKCFLDPNLPGTIIHNKSVKNLPPIIVLKKDQVLVHLKSKDFSFVGESLLSELYQMLSKLRIKPNLIQTGAVSIELVLDNRADKIEKLAFAVDQQFDVQIEKGLTILTVRHYDEAALPALTKGRGISLKQQSATTIQVLMH